MLPVPTKEKDLVRFANDMIEVCMDSSNVRAAQCRLLNQIIETGRTDGQKSKMNMLFNDIDRLTAYLYSPTDLRFILDYINDYPQTIYDRSAVVSRALSREWELNNIDTKFGQGVFESLKYGAAILKQWTETDDEDDVTLEKKLVAPWNFGVYTEDENDLNKQEVLCERVALTEPQVWQRIYRLPGARDLMKRIRSHMRQGESEWASQSYFHQVISTQAINASGTVNASPPIGGVVSTSANPNFAVLSPSVRADRILMHELWVKGPNDFITIQVIEPDILITPYHYNGVVMKMQNLLVPGDVHTGRHPYNLIQPNQTEGYLWGRPEVTDLIETQMLLSMGADDASRLLGIQIDKIIGYQGVDGMTDEMFDKMHGSGWYSSPSSGTIQDLTPKFPEQLLPMLKFYIDQLNTMAGFSDLMQGRGEPGVRAGTHANTLLKTGSPRLRDRSLIVERQCAMAADLTLLLMTAKNGDRFWTKGDTVKDMEESSFILTDLPEDRRVSVDSHSSSPIFADDHQQLTGFGVKAGFIDGEEAIDDLPFPNKERKKQRLRQKQAAQKKQMEELMKVDPEAAAKMMAGGRRR